MSFDVFLVSFRDGVKITGDAESARRVLERHQFERSRQHAYDVFFDDGSSLEMFTSDIQREAEGFDGAMFALRGFTPSIAKFIYEFSRAAGCAIFPAMEPPCVLLPRDDLMAHLPADVPEKFRAIPIANGEELFAALEGGYDSWQAFRNRSLSAPDWGPASDM